MRLRDFVLLAVPLLAVPAFATENHPGKRDVREIYLQLCAGCHGEDLRGGKAGSLIDTEWRYGNEDAVLQRNIVNGIARAGMPPFRAALNDDEARAMVIFIREAAKQAKDGPLPQNSRPLPEGVQTSELQKYRFETVAEGFNVPWSMTFLPGDRMLVTERVGRIHLIEHGKLQAEPLPGVPDVWVNGEGGLLSIAAAPDFEQSGWVYFCFSDVGPENTTMTKVVRARLDDRRLRDVEAIFAAPISSYSDDGSLFGCRLLFDGDYLFFSIGERGRVGDAQDPTTPNGKVHRVFWDGRVPPDNPFVHTPGAVGSVWALGVRNPQGLARDPRDGGLWECEHGPRGGDELNHIFPGHNYGWPVITYGMNYDGTAVSAITEKAGLDQPVKYWTPSIAPCSIHFYTGDKFPRWKNSLFLGSLATQLFLRMSIENGRITHTEEVFKNLGRIRDIQTGPDGYLYLALELANSRGKIVRLVPAD